MTSRSLKGKNYSWDVCKCAASTSLLLAPLTGLLCPLSSQLLQRRPQTDPFCYQREAGAPALRRWLVVEEESQGWKSPTSSHLRALGRPARGQASPLPDTTGPWAASGDPERTSSLTENPESGPTLLGRTGDCLHRGPHASSLGSICARPR